MICDNCKRSADEHPCPQELADERERAADERERASRLKSTATTAHSVIRQLCRDNYGENFADWPEPAQRIINQLDVWGAHQ